MKTGEVRVCKTTKQNEEYAIADLSAKNNIFFGEIALMDNDLRSASIKVIQNCSVLIIHRDKFIQLGDQHPEICLPITRSIATRLCRNLRSANENIIDLFEALVSEVESSHL